MISHHPPCTQVRLPSTMTGLPDRSADPEVAAIQDELEDLNKRLQTGELNIPPEGERSPSPEPIYDRWGLGCNLTDCLPPALDSSCRWSILDAALCWLVLLCTSRGACAGPCLLMAFHFSMTELHWDV